MHLMHPNQLLATCYPSCSKSHLTWTDKLHEQCLHWLQYYYSTDHHQLWWQIIVARPRQDCMVTMHWNAVLSAWVLQLIHNYRYSYTSIVNAWSSEKNFKTWLWNLGTQTLHYNIISPDIQDIVDHRLKLSPNQLNKDVLYNHIGVRYLTAEPSSRWHAPWPSVETYFLVSSETFL